MSDKPKRIRRKVIEAERTHGRVPGWVVKLACGHTTDISGWGDGSGMAAPSTTVCSQCSELARSKEGKQQ